MTARWLALHIFDGGDQAKLIVDSICPTLRRLRASASIGRYFFVRYWNGGPHVRVRLECLRTVDDVEREFRQCVQPFLHGPPADVADIERYTVESARIHQLERRLAHDEAAFVEPVEPMQPPGTIQTRPYRFDEQRYGTGPLMLEDTHDHAWASTAIACSVLELTSPDPDARRVFALHAAAVVPRVIEAGEPTALDYFTRCGDLDASPGETAGERRWAASGFPLYASQRAALNDVRALIDGRDPSTPESWRLLLDAWRQELTRRRQFLAGARREHRLHVHPDHLILDAMHLFLNRLGMELTVECYLYYLIAGTLRDRIAASSNDT